MKRVLITSLIVVTMLASCSEDDPFVPTPVKTGSLALPDSAGTAEGNSANTSPFSEGSERFQSVYGSALLSGIPNGARITGMRFRLNGGQTAFAADTIDVVEVRLSTSRNAPGSLSDIFADNRGSDEVIVRNGQLIIDPSDYPTGGSPNGWGKTILFSTSFVYTGGDLLVEIAMTGLASGNARLTDNVFPSSADSQTGYGTGFSATLADGGLFQDLIVVEYSFSYQ